jgi:hypothetical protein
MEQKIETLLKIELYKLKWILSWWNLIQKQKQLKPF